MRVGQFVVAPGVGPGGARIGSADPVVGHVSLIARAGARDAAGHLAHRERAEPARVALGQAQGFVGGRWVAGERRAAGALEVDRHVPRRRVEEVAVLVLLDLDRVAVGGVAGERVDAVGAEEPAVRVGDLGRRQVGLACPRHHRLRTVGFRGRPQGQAIPGEGVEARMVPDAVRVQASLDVMRDGSRGLVRREPSEAGVVAAGLRERLGGGRPVLRVRRPAGAHDRDAHVPGGVVDQVAEAVLDRLRQGFARGIAPLDGGQ